MDKGAAATAVPLMFFMFYRQRTGRLCAKALYAGYPAYGTGRSSEKGIIYPPRKESGEFCLRKGLSLGGEENLI